MSEKTRNILIIGGIFILGILLGVTITECSIRHRTDTSVSRIENAIESGLDHNKQATDAATNLNSGIDSAIELNTESRTELDRLQRDTEKMLGTSTETERNIETSQGAASNIDKLFGELEAEQLELEELIRRTIN